MTNLILIAKYDIKESLRSKWFMLYMLIFGALIAFFLITGVVDSRVAGFSGLSRMLLLFIQICIVILPIFILIATTRSISKDREMGNLEYLLSFSISLKEYFFGKVLGRAFVIIVPMLLSLLLALILAFFKGASLNLSVFLMINLLLLSLAFVFLAFGFCISALIKNSEFALGFAFLLWIFLLAFMDLTLIGLMMKSGVSENVIYGVALANPLQTFRIGAMALFDPNLSVIAPAAYFILEKFSEFALLTFAVIYPLLLGVLCLSLGYLSFQKRIWYEIRCFAGSVLNAYIS